MDRVIFYLGDEGGVDGEAGKKIVSIRVPEGGLEGLRIVIRNGEKRSNATTSMLIRPPDELGFLKSCCLCRRELNPCQDVYIILKNIAGETRGFAVMNAVLAEFYWMNEESWRRLREIE
ncbi:uncharacterized protein LOC121968621 isoform X3 [Zingiber officinale]|uniref:uncharacterized protein LOC121968621 isoform X3 n=1 Tax=Zingiber officinale TaxID=94328 RepID=UPI001C4CC630|nr:uncharacterized protein LOC121968621 isoform X3 [Zingiber officinale]